MASATNQNVSRDLLDMSLDEIIENSKKEGTFTFKKKFPKNKNKRVLARATNSGRKFLNRNNQNASGITKPKVSIMNRLPHKHNSRLTHFNFLASQPGLHTDTSNEKQGF